MTSAKPLHVYSCILESADIELTADPVAVIAVHVEDHPRSIGNGNDRAALVGEEMTLAGTRDRPVLVPHQRIVAQPDRGAPEASSTSLFSTS